MSLDFALVAIITGVGALISAIGGVFLAIRAVRSRERKAAASELDQLQVLLQGERDARLKAEVHLHVAKLLLAKNGINFEEVTDA